MVRRKGSTTNSARMAKEKPAPRAGGMKRRLRFAVTRALLVILALSMMEGLFSLGMFGYDLAFDSKQPLAERSHTQHDESLGWSNIPGRVVPDLYGPGRTVTINQQGFRNRQEFERPPPAGKLRIVCSGDSFTLGYGVGDDDTFCAHLQDMDPRLEVVNMGQGGYGFDQIYLWYLRDGLALEHNIHLLCLNLHTILRMSSDTFAGYHKPTLHVQNGQIVPLNVPVPGRAYYVPWITENWELLQTSRTIELASRIYAAAASQSPNRSIPESLRLAARAIHNLRQQDEQRGSHLVVVWLPHVEDRTGIAPIWAGLLDHLKSQGITTLDLVPAFVALSEAQRSKLFIKPGDVDFVGAANHYTREGNRFVAELLLAHLRELNLMPDS